MTAYLIQVSVALILFFGIYAWILKKETSFRLARIYLIFSLLASLLVPLIDADSLVSLFIADTEAVYEYWLPDLTASSSQMNDQVSPNIIWIIVTVVYLLGVAIGLLRLIISFLKLRTALNRSRMKQDNEGWYYLMDGDKGSFSFFGYIFIGSKSWHTEEDKQCILKHERAHADLRHSADVMLVQTIAILLWFNPVIYWYRNALEQLHEYEADVIASNNKVQDYCGLLARDALDTMQFTIANHFNKSLTLKRIHMIQSIKRKMSVSKKLGLMGAVLLVIITMACEEKVLTDMKRAAGQSVLLTEYPKEVQDALNSIKSKNPSANFQVYGVVKTEDLEKIDLHGKTATMFFRDNDPDYKVYVILGADEISYATSNLYEVRNGEKVYTIVQHPASPVGGMEEFYRFVGENLKYPEQARRMGVEGRVFIKFMVDEKGKLSDFQIVRGIGAGCDAEAIRVMETAPDWNPGQQDGVSVKSTFNLAVIFKLNAGKEGE